MSSSRPRMLLVGMSHNPGGLELFVMSVFRALKSDFDISFLSFGPEIAFEQEIRTEGGRIVNVTPRERNPVRYLADLERVFTDTRFDVVWLNQCSLSSIGPLAVARRRGVPVRVLHSHQSRNIGSPLTAILHQSKRLMANHMATRALACSDEAARWFYGKAEYTFVPNAFPVERFTFNPAVRQRVRQELGLEEDTIAVGHIANFLPYKNHDFTLEILKELREMGQDVRFIYCGDGLGRREFEQRVSREGLETSAIFLGIRTDIDRVLQGLDVSVLPSISEGLPYTALEAQAAQLPVLLSSKVSPQTAVTEFASFAALDEGAQKWARRIVALGAETQRRAGRNPLQGGPFDVTTFRETLLRSL